MLLNDIQGFLIFGVAVTPVVVVLGWLLLSSSPVQSKVVKPALETALKNDKVRMDGWIDVYLHGWIDVGVYI